MIHTPHGEVEVPVAAIVTGKPVPPRASVRQRVPSATAERHALSLWPHVEKVEVGDWVLRSDPAPSGRLIKRANSALALGDPGVPPAEAAAIVDEFYRASDRPTLVQVEADSPTDEAFGALGWPVVERSDSYFQVASLATALRASGRRARKAQPSGGVHVAEDADHCEVVIGDGLAHGRAGIDADWVGIHAIEVTPRARRRGLAHVVVCELLDWAGSRGAQTAWLHVEVDNSAALALWDSMGFRTHHALRYRTAPAHA